jgi:hypothetical protein
MATVWVPIVILTVRIALSVCPFNRMAHTANKDIVGSTKFPIFMCVDTCYVSTHAF